MTNLTERQQKWFASVRESFVRDTGKSLDDWVSVARTCPETTPRARQAWLKDHHGLGQNRAMQVLRVAFPGTGPAWDDAEALREALWSDAASRTILDAVEATITATLPDALTTQRKGFTAWSRAVQFAAIKPAHGGTAVLGLALPAETSAHLSPAGKESWSERLTARMSLRSPIDANAELTQLLRQAYDRS